MNYKETLKYLYGLERFGMIFGLENISRLLHALGNPHQGLKVIHVGGTNGKGSVSAMVASVLREEGYRVGLYISPHLVSFTERIQVNGIEVSWKDVARLTDMLRKKVEHEGIPQQFTFFDFTTAIAIYYFSLQHVDLAILEVGLGGRLDSTNIVTPLISVITNVERDHLQILGESIKDIAREKAGIVKVGVPLISGVNRSEAIEIIEEECKRKRVPLRLLRRDFSGERIAPRTLNFFGRNWIWDRIKLGLAGPYQIDNAAVALGALEVLKEMGYDVSKESIYEGLSKVRWPGRLELIQGSPQILLDGAHNPAAAMSLKNALYEEFSYRTLFMLVGIMEDKEATAILSELAPLAELLVASRPHNPRAMSPQKIAEIARGYCKATKVIEDVREAVKYLQEVAHEDDLLLITGSLFTVGEAREYLLNKGRE
jgi:dihydrofolate synthase/folylpolyglutamate synthase